VTRNKKKDPVPGFIEKIRTECKRHKIKFKLDKRPYIVEGSSNMTGYFDDGGMELVVCVGRPQEMWLDTLVHESCHLDQWVENCKTWAQCQVGLCGADACTLVDLWLEGLIDLNPTQVTDVVGRVRDLEFDCEKRAVKKIRESGLPIDIKKYIMSANSYILFYTAIQMLRKWNPAGKPPYTDPAILAEMSDKFDMNYDVMTPKLFLLYKRLIES